jgi:hypothetical protein
VQAKHGRSFVSSSSAMAPSGGEACMKEDGERSVG